MSLNNIFKSEMIPDKLDAIVIGSGIGGLGTAALLAKAGKRVLVLERHYVAGGFTHTFRRKGYEWDVGVHYIGEVHRPRSILRQIFDYIADETLKWQPMGEVYDRICFDDATYDYRAPVNAWKEQMFDYFPSEKTAIEKYLDAVFATVRATKKFFMERALPPLIGKLASPFLTKKFLHYSDRTTLEVLQEFTKNPRLIAVLTGQYGDYGLPPGQSSFGIHALVTNHYFSGGAYPVGGSSSIARAMVPKIEAAGGVVLVKAEVERVLVKNGTAVGVALQGGEQILAPVVISDAGAYNTFEKLLSGVQDGVDPIRKQLHTIERSCGHLCLYVGIKQTAQELGLKTTNLWIYPGDDHDESLANFTQNPNAPFPVVYISFPSAKDPNFEKNFPGRATLEALTVAPYEWFTQWEDTFWRKRGEKYEKFKEGFSERLLESVNRWVPEVRGKIDYHELSTPLSTRHFANYQRGEIYGLAHTPARFRQKWLRPRTPIKNFYLTGQDIVSDGLGGALMGAVLTASAVEGKNLLGKILKGS